MIVQSSALPNDSGLRRYMRAGDFHDCYSVEIDDPDAPIDLIAQQLLLDFPLWIKALLKLRDVGVSPFALKQTRDLPQDRRIRARLEVGDVVNFFRVHHVSEQEIILGEDDRHLDFRIAVRRDWSQNGRVSIATWVRPHNRLGRAYLKLVQAPHIMIVSSQLRMLKRRFA